MYLKMVPNMLNITLSQAVHGVLIQKDFEDNSLSYNVT